MNVFILPHAERILEKCLHEHMNSFIFALHLKLYCKMVFKIYNFSDARVI